MTMKTNMGVVNGSTHQLSVSGTTARTTTAFTNTDIRIYCATACFVKFGDNTVTASTSSYDVYVPAGQPYDLDTRGAQYVAVILASGSDTAYINEWTNKQI